MAGTTKTSSSQIIKHKHFLRGYYRRAVSSLSAASRRRESLQIARRLERLPAFRNAKTVALYISRWGEVDTRPILDLCRKRGKAPVAPVVDPETRRMSFHEWPRRSSHLRRNIFGLWEPSPEKCRAAVNQEIGLVLVPGRAFTRRGGRLGAGGGYYDRFLPRVPKTPRIGLAFGVQLAVRLPLAKHDQKLTGVLTANNFFRA